MSYTITTEAFPVFGTNGILESWLPKKHRPSGMEFSCHGKHITLRWSHWPPLVTARPLVGCRQRLGGIRQVDLLALDLVRLLRPGHKPCSKSQSFFQWAITQRLCTKAVWEKSYVIWGVWYIRGHFVLGGTTLQSMRTRCSSA